MARYLTVDEIYAEMAEIAGDPAFSGLVTLSDLGAQTSGGRPLKVLRINKAIPGVTPVPVLVTGGVHAREWCPPEALVDFSKRFLTAFKTSSPYIDPRFVMTIPGPDSKNDPGFTSPIVFDETLPALFSFPDVERVMGYVELFVVPLVNPDGRAYSQLGGDIPGMTDVTHGAHKPLQKLHWRKNRRNMGLCADGSDAIGVDINRSFNTTPSWDADKYYDAASMSTPATRGNISVSTVADTCKKDIDDFFSSFHGTASVTEKETQNIIDLVRNKKIRFFLDIHSHQREIYYPWGINPAQTTDPFKSMFNTSWDNASTNPVAAQHGRPFDNSASYSEFFPVQSSYDLMTRHIQLATAMHNLILAAAGSDAHAQKRSNYAVKPSFTLYSSPGDVCDYVFSTQLEKDTVSAAQGFQAKIKTALFPVYAFTIETGHISDGEFWPSKRSDKNQFFKVRREGQFALIALLKYVANWSSPASAPVTTPPPQGTSTGEGCRCVILIALAGMSMVGYLFFMVVQKLFF